MAITRVSDNQIADTTNAIITTLSFLNETSVFRLPSGSTGNQPSPVSPGTLRFNTDNDNAEIYVSDTGQGSPGWTEVAGGGPSIGNDSIIRCNDATLTESVTVGPTANGGTEYSNSFSMGPITIASGVTVDIESGYEWNILSGRAIAGLD